jgi:hypothetical protein
MPLATGMRRERGALIADAASGGRRASSAGNFGMLWPALRKIKL